MLVQRLALHVRFEIVQDGFIQAETDLLDDLVLLLNAAAKTCSRGIT